MGIVTRGAAAAAQEGGLKLRKSGSYPLVSGAGVAVVPPRKDKDSFRILVQPAQVELSLRLPATSSSSESPSGVRQHERPRGHPRTLARRQAMKPPLCRRDGGALHGLLCAQDV